MNQPPNIDDKRLNDLLEQWAGGDFNRADETELDALGEMDDFRKEALAGYRAVPEADHSARLQAMRARLQAQTGMPEATGGKRIMLPWVWAAAAALALLIVAVFFFAPPQPTATFADQSVADEQQPGLPAGNADVPAPDASDAYLNPWPKAKGVAPTQGKQAQYPVGASNAEEFPALMTDVAVSEEVAAAEDEVPPISSAPASPPAPMAELPAKTNAAKPVKEEAAKKVPSGISPETAKHDTESRADLDGLRKDVRAEGEPLPAPEPVEGWERFREYLRQNARLTTEARNQNVSGVVRLQFAVLSDGTPTNFTVVRRLGYGCEEEGIRLIKEWEWIPGKYNFLTVDIAFNR